MIEIFLSIASFSISVGGLVAVFVVKNDKKKEIVFSVVVAAIIVISGATLYSSYQHEKYVDRVQDEIVKILSLEALTFDDLYQNIFPPVSHELLREALYGGIEERFIGYRPMRLQSNGKMMSVKVFYAR
ncbi:MAG: hypothetical protein AUK24_10070 [Syntrophaceae bacterium CG2_30_49_12]|nr:MAG: hypothetical protein AUK24_10070 [Syntrophaceae bacterium CG2_30_49_12]PJC72529.1 MAG: hypothetical protein CO012_11985 [Syntrophobacterales bacterium CG_4_8_14_3_um_filter_49_14]